MTAPASVLAVIPARGGSKGLPGKNTRPLAGKPLVCHSIEQALAAHCVTTALLSSDDSDILACGHRYPDCQLLPRPAHLADDHTAMTAVAAHALEQYPEHEWLLLLQPTSPLRTAADIDSAFTQAQAAQASSCVSVCATAESPFLMYLLDNNRCLQPVISGNPFTRRQDLPPSYTLNGAIYLIQSRIFRREAAFIQPDTTAYIMPRQRSIDIDTRADFELCARVLTTVEPAQ